MERMVDEDVVGFVRVMREMPPASLTFAAEILGKRCRDGWLVTATLLPLCDHEDSAVREGAIYGLQRHPSYTARQKIEQMALSDASGAVRQAAQDVLKEDWQC